MKYNGIICEANKPAKVARVQRHVKRDMTAEDYQRELDHVYNQLDDLYQRAGTVGGYTPATEAEITALNALIPALNYGVDFAPTRAEWQPVA